MGNMDLGHCSDEIVVLNTIEVPDKYYKRILCGVEVLDELFGGSDMPGILPGASILTTGFPGSGKSTLMLQLADLIQRFAGRSVLYNCGEENRYMVKMAADRLKIGGDFCMSQIDNLEKLKEVCIDSGVEVLIQDSLQTLTYGDYTGNKLIKYVGKELAKFASYQNITIFIVGQITKGGEFAGPMQIKHAVDAHMHLSFNKDTGNRVFELTKNRFGPAMMPYEFFLSADGLDFRQQEPQEETAKKTKTSRKKDSFVEKAKELLLNGSKLSGYSCMEDQNLVKWIEAEHDGNCSGNFWRVILAMAKCDLESNGHIIGVEKINRREHIYVEV